MFKKLLLPLDLTNKHQPAIDTAVELVRQSNGEICLIHVIEVIPGLSIDEEKSFYDRLEKAARTHLERCGNGLNQRHVAWRHQVRYGNRASEIVRYAKEDNTSLIVLSSPRIDPHNPSAGWGSLSYKISLLSPCPVLLVR